MFFRVIFFVTTLFVSLKADIIKPAYLEITQKDESIYSILLKVPMKNDKTPPLEIGKLTECKEVFHVRKTIKSSSIDRYRLKCTESIKGKKIVVKGLEDTNMELLLRLNFLDGRSDSQLLNPEKNSYKIKEDASILEVVKTYTWLGITHILLGFDHLLFVFALLLIVKNFKRLLWTLTAFTLSHSITMAGATLGLVHLPQAPVEAIIALSILFLAMEIVHQKRGKVGLTYKYPWLIAFIFGLLHGFGFAGALAEIGLPQKAITTALIFFNIGVEIGQLIFVTAVIVIALLLKQLKHPKLLERAELIILYMIGGLSAFWLIERISAFFVT
jgi:hydrogenase/urease accessory protein HupE